MGWKDSDVNGGYSAITRSMRSSQATGFGMQANKTLVSNSGKEIHVELHDLAIRLSNNLELFIENFEPESKEVDFRQLLEQ